MTAVQWIVMVGMGALGGYGLLNLVLPSLTIGWQMRSTAKVPEGGIRRTVGTAVAGVVGQDDSLDPPRDPAVRRRVRWIGVAEIVVALVVSGAMWSASR